MENLVVAVVADNFVAPEFEDHRGILGVVLLKVSLVVEQKGSLAGGHMVSLGAVVNMEKLVPLDRLE